ncbi:MAG: transglutaminase [Arcobacter sp.]|nr:MAG: transglutaminase [Arcobacter sp.]
MFKILRYFIVTTIFCTLSFGSTTSHISSNQLIQIGKKYGKKARQRILLWEEMLVRAKNKKTLVKLKMVNDFFNQITYKKDSSHWKKKDYWASPLELLATGAGDCEDYAIAKYFALRTLGIPEKKLKIAHVTLQQRDKKFDEAHTVLNYYHKSYKTAVVLDNVNKKLILATNRKDLKPIERLSTKELRDILQFPAKLPLFLY